MAAREISAVDDPLSRLIACAYGSGIYRLMKQFCKSAFQPASVNGWRALWAYLSRLQTYYTGNGDLNKAAAIGERLNLLKKD